MQTKIKFPSKRLLLLLSVSAGSVILLECFDIPENTSFLFNLLTLICGLLITVLFYLPSAYIKRKTNIDFMSMVHIKTPSAVVFVSAVYCCYFVFTAEYFLLKYSDMYLKKLNSEVNIFAVVLILIAVCVYAAYKGTNAVARCSIFIFAFSIIAYILIFWGNISNLELKPTDFVFTGDLDGFINNTSFFITPAFTAVIFSVVSGYTKNFRTRQLFFSFAVIAILFALFLFFSAFVLRDYAFSQDYRCFLLSKTSHFGEVSGLDSLYLVISLSAIFLIISLLLTCICKSTGKSSNFYVIMIFSLIIFVFFICACKFNSIKEILTNQYIFNVFSFITAVIIPAVYILIFGRRMNV